MFWPIFWKMEHGDPLILFHFLTACAINNRFWQKIWHILFDPKLSWATLKENCTPKMIIFDLVGFHLFCSMVKIRGQNSNWKMVKQTAKNGQNISGDDDVAGVTALVKGVKNSRLRNGLEFDRPYLVFYGFFDFG